MTIVGPKIRVLMGLVVALAWLAPVAALAAQPGVEVPTVPGLDTISPLAAWQIGAAFVLPLIVAALTSAQWRDATKALVTFALSYLVTVIGLVVQGGLTGADLALGTVAVTGLKIFAFTIPFYYGLWKQVGLTGAIHRATG